ncbi:MAG: ABC transporter ATP-binding protein [Planctomycetes bacterium]|nr:ABC transporter ATP-binding protein [Planctomycetota bacterium]
MIEHDDKISGRIFDRRILRRILPFAKPHAPLFILATVLLFVLFGIEVFVTFLWPRMIDGIVGGPERTLSQSLAIIAVPLGLYSAAVVALGGLRYYQNKILAHGGQEVIYDIRKALFGHLQTQPFAFYDRHAVGRLVTRVTSDVENVSELFTSGLATAVYDVLKVAGVAIILIVLDWRLGCVAVGLAPLLALVSLWFRGRARESFRGVRTWLGKSNGYLQEAIAGIRVVQVFGKEEKVALKFEKITQGYLAANIRTVFYFAIFFPLVESAMALDQSSVFLVGGHGIEAGRVSIGKFIQFTFLLEFLYSPLRELGEKYNVLQAAMASAERIFKLLDEKSAIVSTAAHAAPIRGDVRLDKINFSYDGVIPILKDLSLRVAPGETLALVGATGAGKTTVASLLARFYDIGSGTVAVDGVDVRAWNLTRLRESIGFVPQDLFLFAGTILDNITLWRPGISREKAKQALRAVGADVFVAKLAPADAADRLEAGLDAPVAERGVTFSAGERQLLAFARALAGDPAIVILDEATANVDTETEIKIQEGVHALLRGRTSIVIAHRLSTVREATRIAVLHHGELRELGTHEELLARGGIYAKLVKLQFEG